MDFSGGAGATSNFDLLPKNALLFANLQVRGVKSGGTGSRYLDVELTIDAGQPFAGRKLFDKIGDPNHPGNSEAYRQMGMIAITRILEAGRGAGPNNPQGYQIANYEQLSGLRVAIKVGVEDGTDGHDDKNRVSDFLTPNPASASGHKLWLKLQAGDHNLPGPAAGATQAQGGFGGFGGGTPTPTPAATGGFGNAGGAGAAATTGFGQTQGASSAEPATGQPSTTGFASTNGATDQSPSNPAATPGWLAQAAQ